MTDYNKTHAFEQQSGDICTCGYRREHQIHQGAVPRARASSSGDTSWTNLWLGLIFVLLVITNVFGLRIGPYVECEFGSCEDKVGLTWGR